MRDIVRLVSPHLAASSVFVAATAWWLSALLPRMRTAVLGSGPGDNLVFVWNAWWMSRAVSDPSRSFFRSPDVFYPFGVDLTLHTHTALPGLAATVLSHAVGLLASVNLVVLFHIFANFLVSYVLFLRLTRHVPASTVAALVFGWSPYIAGHMLGHFNLVAAWPLPLAALLSNADPARRIFRRVLLGLLLTATVYIDYYHAIYAGLLVAILVMGQHCSLAVRTVTLPPSLLARRLAALLFVLGFVCVCAALSIVVFGGGAIHAGPLRISMRSPSNPLTGAWIALWAGLFLRWGPQLRSRLTISGVGSALRDLSIPAVITVAGVAPLLGNVVTLWRAGDYASQRYLWRSAPGGVDISTLLTNPFGLFEGPVVRGLFEGMNVDLVERVAFLGVPVLALAAWSVRRLWHVAEVRVWMAATGIFGVWALGPYLTVAGHSTPFILPATFVRFLPVLANARMPGRAIIVVYLGVAVLVAFALAALFKGTRRARLFALGASFLIFVEYLPSPAPVYIPDSPAPYHVLSAAPAGAVLDVPLGLRDGFGETGLLDSRVLWYQTLHGKPIAGGFVARMPPRMVADYSAVPPLSTFLQLSTHGAGPADPLDLPIRSHLIRSLNHLGFRYVVLHQRTAPVRLANYVKEQLDLPVLAADSEHTVYVLPSLPPSQ